MVWETPSQHKRRMDFEPCFKVHNLVPVYPESIKLSQLTILNVVFYVVVSIYRLVEI